jgi:CelD/BcsL family acetyltransferase involved in cellulose biosynthesis
MKDSRADTQGCLRSAVVDTWAGFDDLEPEWNPVLARSRANSIFLSWEWIKSWSDVVGATVQPLIVTVRDPAGRLVGMAPFYTMPIRLLGVLQYRALRIMGDYPTGAEYGDWIQDPDCERAVAQAIIDTLEDRGGWDCVWMPRVAGWTGAKERVFDVCLANGWFAHSRPTAFAAFRLPPTWDEYLEMLSPKKRGNVRNETKRSSRQAHALVECTSAEELPRLLDALFDLHHVRWSTVGDEGAFRRKPQEAAFYRAFAPRALEKGWLRLFAMEEHGDIKAVQIGYAYSGTFHAMQEGFDPRSAKSLGSVLRARVIERCIQERLAGYDFLGGVSDHKRRWAAEERTGWDWLLGHRSWKNRLLFEKDIWPTGRYFRPVIAAM